MLSIKAFMFIILNIKHNRTKQIKLAKQENITAKNWGTRHLKIPKTKLPSILLGITKILISKSGFNIRPDIPKCFDIIRKFKMLDNVIDNPVPTINALMPRYFGNITIDKTSRMLPTI